MSAPARRIVFVCTGNICRSPMAEAMARQLAGGFDLGAGRTLADELAFESAGTASWHVGDDMDPRARRALELKGFAADRHSAQHADDALIERSDLLVALDRKHRQILLGRSPGAEIVMLRPFAAASGGQVDIPDPYYGEEEGFAVCAGLIEASVAGLLESLGSELG